MSLKMPEKCGNKRKHNLAKDQDKQNDRQKDQTEASNNPHHPEEDNYPKKKSDRASCSPASTKQWHQDPKNKKIH